MKNNIRIKHKKAIKNMAKRGSKKCPTMKSLARQWRGMSTSRKAKFPKRGSKSRWNAFVAKKRKGCTI